MGRASRMSESVTFIDFFVRGIALDGKKKTPILLLQDRHERLLLPIWIGAAEAGAIYCALEGRTLSRPMTHDLIMGLCETTGVRILGLDIRELNGGTFLAAMRIEKQDGTTSYMDCRPSDHCPSSPRQGTNSGGVAGLGCCAAHR